MKHASYLLLCAWVIWMKATGDPATEWTPNQGYPTYEQCMRDVHDAIAEDKRKGEDKKWMWRCFPEATDRARVADNSRQGEN
jgi:hypothetical protein